MKTLNSILFCLLFISFAQAQSDTEAELEKRAEELRSQLEGQKGYTKTQKDKLEAEVKKLEEKKEELKRIEQYEENFGQARIIALDEVNERIKSIPFFQKLGSKMAYYKCLRSSLEEKQFLNEKYCSSWHSPGLSSEEKEKINEWNKSVGMTLTEASVKKENLPREIQSIEGFIPTYQKNIEFSEAREETINKEIKNHEAQRDEYKLLPGLSNMVNCNENTPTINLEEEVPFPGAKFKGPYVGVPRDNQDGLGTCYANAAKNLLVGLSDGKDVASFLDLALVYKNANGEISSSGLDGGNSCSTLEAAAKTGYCPQHFSQLEGGERDTLGESLFNLGKYNYLATSVDLVRDFLGDLDSFQKKTSTFNAEILSRSKYIIDSIKNNSDINLPVPVARFEIPEMWKLKEAYHLYAPKTKKESEFLKEYDEAYRVFYPKYVKAVMQGKNADQVFDIFKSEMNAFLTSNNLLNSLPEFKRVFKTNTDGDFKDPKLQQKIRASVDFLKDLMNKKDLTDDAFFDFCAAEGADSLRFIGSLQPVIQKIRDNTLNPDALFDKEGKFRSAYELLQLTVAPSCLNKENRKPLPAFTCSRGYDTVTKIRAKGKTKEEQNRLLREKVILNLVQGYGVGNSFMATATTAHINTIVGMRFNKQLNRCEVLIRESQNGSSGWHSEDSIFNKMQALSEVRKVK